MLIPPLFDSQMGGLTGLDYREYVTVLQSKYGVAGTEAEHTREINRV
jgi:hypothetical protein